jgi:hypothetical protein
MSSNIYTNTMPSAGNQAYGYQAYISSDYVRSKVQDFANSANQFANQFFEKPAVANNTEKVKVVHHYHSYSPYYSFWDHYSFWNQPVVIIRDRSSKNDDDTNTKLFGAISIVGALIATYTVGIALSSMKELEQTKRQEADLSLLDKNVAPEDQMLLKETKEAISLKGRICERLTNSATWDLRLRLAVATGLAMTGYGALMTPVVTTTIQSGMVLTLASLGGILFKSGFESSSKANITDAKALKAVLNNLSHL